jgi:hypothetical protein
VEEHKDAKYESTKIVNLVVEMIFRADRGMLADTFKAEKAALRAMVKRAHRSPERPGGKRKNEGQLPSPVTFEKVINSLEPIYQELRKVVRSKFE